MKTRITLFATNEVHHFEATHRGLNGYLDHSVRFTVQGGWLYIVDVQGRMKLLDTISVALLQSLAPTLARIGEGAFTE